MKKLISVIGATIGGYGGWALGGSGGLMLAFVLSVVGTGLGMYWARRFVRDHLD